MTMNTTHEYLDHVNAQERFLRYLIEGSSEPGYIEIIAGIRSPTHPPRIRMVTHTQRWFWCSTSTSIAHVLEYIQKLARTFTDIYASYRLYRIPYRSSQTAIESTIIFIDDVPPVPPNINGTRPIPMWSWYVQTSPTHGHGYIRCTKPVSDTDRAIITALVGGDPSGSDAVQLVRIPGTYNSKYEHPYPVQMIAPTPQPPPIAIDTITHHYATTFPKRSRHSTPQRCTATPWNNLPDGNAILQSRRLRRLLPHRPQLAAVLRGERIALQRGTVLDSSRSSQVACVVYHLMGANFPESEVRAVALALRQKLRPDRPQHLYQRDIDREIERYRPPNYHPRPTIHTSHHKHDHHNQPVRAYWRWLQRIATPTGVVLLSQRECAEAYGRSIRTIKRYEHILRLRRRIRRAPFGGRQYGRLFLIQEHRTPPSHRNPIPHRPSPPVPPSTYQSPSIIRETATAKTAIQHALHAVMQQAVPIRKQYQAVVDACRVHYDRIGERWFRILYRDIRDRENIHKKPISEQMAIMIRRHRWYEYNLTTRPESPVTRASYFAWIRAYECVHTHSPPG